MKKILGGAPKGPSAADLEAQRKAAEDAQNAAIEKERERLAAESAAKAEEEKKNALASLTESESKRRAFAGTLTAEGDDSNRRKFLKSA